MEKKSENKKLRNFVWTIIGIIFMGVFVFVGIILGLVFIQAISNSIVSFCG